MRRRKFPAAPSGVADAQRHLPVYRKLHENVASFKAFIAEQAAGYARINGLSGKDAA
jgi:dihydroorotase-like cyclic amidohydrolase